MKRAGLTRREFLQKTSTGVAAASVLPLGAARASNPNALALNGGTPVRTRAYPT